jgi:hypothetical protein
MQEWSTTQYARLTGGRRGERYIVSALSEADWVKNVRAAGEGSLTRGKHSEAVRLVELPEPERNPVLRGCRWRWIACADEPVGCVGVGAYPA